MDKKERVWEYHAHLLAHQEWLRNVEWKPGVGNGLRDDIQANNRHDRPTTVVYDPDILGGTDWPKGMPRASR